MKIESNYFIKINIIFFIFNLNKKKVKNRKKNMSKHFTPEKIPQNLKSIFKSWKLI